MKFSLSSWNPFAWVKQEPMTANQIRLYDIGQDIAGLDEELMSLELERIELEHERLGLIAQRNFIIEGEKIEAFQPFPFQSSKEHNETIQSIHRDIQQHFKG